MAFGCCVRGTARSRASWAALLRAIVLTSHQGAMPPQDRVGGHESGELIEKPPAEGVASDRETAALCVGEPQPATRELFTKDPVFLEQILNRSLLLAVDPTREDHHEKLKGNRAHVHAFNAAVLSRIDKPVGTSHRRTDPSAEYWDRTGFLASRNGRVSVPYWRGFWWPRRW